MKARAFTPFVLISLIGFFELCAWSATLKPSPSRSPHPHKKQTPQKLKISPEMTDLKNLAEAARLIDLGKFAEAKAKSSSVRNREKWGDYQKYLTSKSLRLLAASKKLQSEKIKLLSQAEQTLITSDSVGPYSPLIKARTQEQALTELAQGILAHQSKNTKKAVQKFENAFLRLWQQNEFSLVRPEHLTGYALACRKPISLCTDWLEKLGAMYPKRSVERQAISAANPDLKSRIKLSAPSRLSQSYKNPDKDLTAFDLLFQKYLERKKDFESEFEFFIKDYPNSALRFRARFLLSLSKVRDKELDFAKAQWAQLADETPLSFYGLASRLLLNRAIDEKITPSRVLAIPGDSEDLTALESFRLSRSRLISQADAWPLASFEMKEFKARDSLSNAFLEELASMESQAENHLSVFNLIGELIQRGEPSIYREDVLKWIFPVPARIYPLIEKQAFAKDINPILILSLIKQESAFESHAMSSSGAMGLMQLMPATASDTDPKVARADLVENTDRNIQVGTLYLSKLLKKYQGNITYALAGYNAGPGAVFRWIGAQKERNLKDPKTKFEDPVFEFLDFTETIPYKETREYVQSITRNYFWYSRRLKKPIPESLAFCWDIKKEPIQILTPDEPDPTSE